MKKIGIFVLGVVAGGVLFSGVAVGAANYLKASIYNVKIVVDNKEAKLSDQPLNVNGKTYLPLRDTANALGYGVSSVTSSKIELKSGGATISIPSNPNTGSASTNNNNGSTLTKPSNGKGEYVRDLKTKYSTDEKLDAAKLKIAIDSGEITVNAQDEATGDSLLQMVIKENNYNAYLAIKRNALNVNTQNKEGQTALHTAVIEENDFYFGELLNSLKANSKIKDNNGLQPIDYAKKNSSFQLGLEADMLFN